MKERPIKVLIVEDEVLVGLMLARKLRSLGYDVGDVATTGEEALRRVEQDYPQVIIMDVTLSGKLNGLEAAVIIKKKHNIPIIIFSGYDDALMSKQAEEINPVAVLSKMGPFSEITRAIEKAVDV